MRTENQTRPAKRKHQITKLAKAFAVPVIEHEMGSYIKLETPTGVYYIINNDLREHDTVLIATEKYDDHVKVSVHDIADRFTLFINNHGLVPREYVKGVKPAMMTAKELLSEFR